MDPVESSCQSDHVTGATPPLDANATVPRMGTLVKSGEIARFDLALTVATVDHEAR